jgi:hypothetical protein
MELWHRSLEPESLRKQFLDMCLLRSIGTLKKHDCIRSELIDHLAARPARGTRNALIVRHRDGLNFDFWS